MTARLGIIADDLTGAGDAGLQFFRKGMSTWLISPMTGGNRSAFETGGGPLEAAEEVPEVPADVAALAVNAAGRTADTAQAADRAARAASWLRSAGCQQYYHKIDSTLRGNVGAEVGRLLHELGLDLAVVAPAFPEAGRITVGGFQLVDGVPVSLSCYGHDPLGPALESHLPTLLHDAGNKTELIDLRTVLGGWEKIVGAIAEARARGTRVVVLDAARTEDLTCIGQAIAHLGPKVLPVGSAGLAMALRPLGLVGAFPSLLRVSPRPTGQSALLRAAPVLVISGSCNPVTLDQVAALEKHARIVMVDVAQLLLTEGRGGWPIESHEELESTARQALQGLLAGRDVVVTTASSTNQIERDQMLGRDLGLSPPHVGAQLGRALGALARRLTATAEVSGLVACGGETAAVVCRALGADRLEIAGEVCPAIPLLRPVGLDLRLVTKSGGFGETDTLRQIARYLRQDVLS